MRQHLETQFSCRIVSWSEPADDLGGVIFSAFHRGRLVVAESLALLISALQDEDARPVWLLAA